MFLFVCLILYVPSTIFQLTRDRSSWVEPVLSQDKCVLLKDNNAVTPVRLKPAAPQSQVKHSTTEPLRSLKQMLKLMDKKISTILHTIMRIPPTVLTSSHKSTPTLWYLHQWQNTSTPWSCVPVKSLTYRQVGTLLRISHGCGAGLSSIFGRL